MDRNNVVLVDKNDNPLSEMEKLMAHEKGVWVKQDFPEKINEKVVISRSCVVLKNFM